MFRLLSYLKQCKKSVLAIVLLLIVQAYCDLALPQYTSDIVDVGIQQGGITYAAPEWMREETWGSLQNLITEGEKELTASCYEQAEDGTYERTTNKTADLEALNDTFRMPMVMLSAMDESAETALNDGADAAAPTKEQLQLLQALQNGSLSEEQLLSLRALPECWFVVCKPQVSFSTAEMYRRLDEAGMAVHPDTRRMMDALQRRDLAEIFSQIGNVFEQVLPPGSEIFAIRDRLLTLGAGTACMSGSGSAVVGFFSQEEAARSSAAAMTEVPFVRCVGRG